MRIIAGQRRGHKFDGPKAAAALRPTSDLVRESLFNIIGPLVAGREVVDLFAGTGALGLEALSRGAARAVFVERNRENVALIHRNIATLRYEDRSQVRLADAYRWARGYQPADGRAVAVFLDPPYRDHELRPNRMRELLTALAGKLPDGSVIALEAGGGLDEKVLPEPASWDVRRYGETRIAVRVLQRAATGETGDGSAVGHSPPDGAREEEHA